MSILKVILKTLSSAIVKLILSAVTEKALMKLIILGGNKLTTSTKNTLDDKAWNIIVSELESKGIKL